MEKEQEIMYSTERYNDLSLKECVYRLIDSDEYWDIYQQLSHHRWDSVKKGSNQPWMEVSFDAAMALCLLDDNELMNRRDDLIDISILFYLGHVKVEVMGEIAPEKTQAE